MSRMSGQFYHLHDSNINADTWARHSHTSHGFRGC